MCLYNNDVLFHDGVLQKRQNLWQVNKPQRFIFFTYVLLHIFGLLCPLGVYLECMNAQSAGVDILWLFPPTWLIYMDIMWACFCPSLYPKPWISPHLACALVSLIDGGSELAANVNTTAPLMVLHLEGSQWCSLCPWMSVGAFTQCIMIFPHDEGRLAFLGHLAQLLSSKQKTRLLVNTKLTCLWYIWNITWVWQNDYSTFLHFLYTCISWMSTLYDGYVDLDMKTCVMHMLICTWRTLPPWWVVCLVSCQWWTFSDWSTECQYITKHDYVIDASFICITAASPWRHTLQCFILTSHNGDLLLGALSLREGGGTYQYEFLSQDFLPILFCLYLRWPKFIENQVSHVRGCHFVFGPQVQWWRLSAMAHSGTRKFNIIPAIIDGHPIRPVVSPWQIMAAQFSITCIKRYYCNFVVTVCCFRGLSICFSIANHIFGGRICFSQCFRWPVLHILCWNVFLDLVAHFYCLRIIFVMGQISQAFALNWLLL